MHQNRFAGSITVPAANHTSYHWAIHTIRSGGEQMDVGTPELTHNVHVRGRSNGIERTIFPHGIPLRCRERLPPAESAAFSMRRCQVDAHLHIRA